MCVRVVSVEQTIIFIRIFSLQIVSAQRRRRRRCSWRRRCVLFLLPFPLLYPLGHVPARDFEILYVLVVEPESSHCVCVCVCPNPRLHKG